MTDDELKRLLQQAMLNQARRAVTSLLAGNDSQCFTTEQYKAAYQQVAKCGDWVWRITSRDLAREHMLKTGMVREVAPDLWAEARQP